MIKRQRVQRDLTRPAGVRVDGPLARGFLRFVSLTRPTAVRVVVAAGAADYKKGARLAPRVVFADAQGATAPMALRGWKKVLKMDRPDGRRVLKFDGPSGRGLLYRPAGDEYEVSVTDLPFCIIRYDRNSADWLAALASPYPASPDFPRSSVGQSKGRPFYGQAKGLL